MTKLEQTGIYQIINKINGKNYIGSTRRSFRKRFFDHRNNLKNNKHHSSHLQRAYNKYGLDNFSFDILEIIDKSLDKNYFLEREQYYIDLFNTTKREFGYNIALKADLPPTAANPEYYGHKTSLRLVPEGYLVQHPNELEWLHFFNLHEFCRIFELNPKHVQKVLYQDWSSLHNYKFKFANEERNKIYEEKNVILKNGILKRKQKRPDFLQYLVTYPNGEKIKIANLKKFSEEHNLIASNLLAVARGKRDNCKGFKCEYLDKNKYKKFVTVKEKPPTFLIRNDETGKEYLVNSVREWCIKQGWESKESNTLRSTQNGSIKIQHKNHRCYSIDKLNNNTQLLPKCDFKYKVITNVGKVYFVESLMLVAEKENINFRYLYECVSGKRVYTCLKDWQVIKL